MRYVVRVPNIPTIPAADAARILGVSVHTVGRYARRGVLTPVVRTPGLRGAYLFDRRDVERLAKRRGAA